MNPLGKSNENRQKVPEVRHLSKDATEMFLNTVRPSNYRAAENLKQMVQAVVPEHFVQPELEPVVAPKATAYNLFFAKPEAANEGITPEVLSQAASPEDIARNLVNHQFVADTETTNA